MSIILGIDPGSRITGYGVIRIVAGKADETLVESYLHGHRLAEQLVALAD